LASCRLWRQQQHQQSNNCSINTTTIARTPVPTGAATTPSAPLPEDQSNEDLRYRATRIIVPIVRDSIMPHIMHIDDPRKTWIKLINLYQSNSMNRHLSLKSQLYSLKMTDKMSIEEHLRNVSSLT
jgi:hypothetical protein